MSFLYSEKGSVTPFFAIGGAIVLICVFWVDNISYSVLEKSRQISNADALTRVSLIGEGLNDDNANKILSAVSAEDSTASYQFTSKIDFLNLKEIVSSSANIHSITPIRNSASTSKSVEVPFADINESIGNDRNVNINTYDRSIKLIKPINVIIAIENTPENKNNVNLVRQPLIQMVTKLFYNAYGSRVSIIPYSFRVNLDYYCYTGISRGDKFSFKWWENFYYEEEILKRMIHKLREAELDVTWVGNIVRENEKNLESLRAQLANATPGTPQYNSISVSLAQLGRNNNDANIKIVQSKAAIDKLNKEIPGQQSKVDSMMQSEQYEKYLPLANHYNIHEDNYPLLEDYNDVFANSNGYSISREDFSHSASDVTSAPDSLSDLAVKTVGFFADTYTDTCPSVPVVNDSHDYNLIKDTILSIPFDNKKLKSLEGILWAGRMANNSSGTNRRSLILVFASDKKESLGGKGNSDAAQAELQAIQNSCAAIQSSWYRRNAIKIVFIVPDQEAKKKFLDLQCATPQKDDAGYIVLDDIKPTPGQSISDTIEARLLYLISQESTSRDAQP